MDESKTSDPLTIVRQLDAGTIRRQLDAMDRERKALLVLLRAAVRVEREDQQTEDRSARTS